MILFDNSDTDLLVSLSQEEISERDVDPHFKYLFKQIAGNVGRGRTDSI